MFLKIRSETMPGFGLWWVSRLRAAEHFALQFLPPAPQKCAQGSMPWKKNPAEVVEVKKKQCL